MANEPNWFKRPDGSTPTTEVAPPGSPSAYPRATVSTRALLGRVTVSALTPVACLAVYLWLSGVRNIGEVPTGTWLVTALLCVCFGFASYRTVRN